MIYSMTGYGHSEGVLKRLARAPMRCEIRSINSKTLDIQFKASRAFQGIEGIIQERIKKVAKRGRIEVGLFLETSSMAAQSEAFEMATADWLRSLSKSFKLKGALTMADFLKAIEIKTQLNSQVATAELSKAELQDVLLMVDRAVAAWLKSRASEGVSLQKSIQLSFLQIQKHVNFFKSESPKILVALKKRIKERMGDLIDRQKLQPDRLEQEITFWVLRSDIQEEIDRLQHHLKTFREHRTEGGRKLEFVLQEIQREANTLSSKCADPRVLNRTVDLKSAIERIREQLQNME